MLLFDQMLNFEHFISESEVPAAAFMNFTENDGRHETKKKTQV